MTLKIEPRLGVEVYVNNEETISITNPNQENAHGEVEDVVVRIHPDYIDDVIKALQECRKEIKGGDWVNNG